MMISNRILQLTGVSICVFFLSFVSEAQQNVLNKISRIDSHIHLYDTNRKESSVFLDSVKQKKIYYPHLAKEFLETASPAGIKYAVVIEASQRREDNFWAMDIVNKSENLLAFVANLDPRDPLFISDMEILLKSEKFRGIRIRPKTKIDISTQEFLDQMGELDKRNLVIEFGPNQEPVEAIEKIAHTYPNMNIIINHMAGGCIRNNKIVPGSWNARLKRLSALPNVYCKISALYTLSGKSPAPIDVEFYKLFIDQVVNAFGSDRVIYGSNWTLSDMLGSYVDLVKIYDDYLEGNVCITPEQLYLDNIRKAYGLNCSEQY